MYQWLFAGNHMWILRFSLLKYNYLCLYNIYVHIRMRKIFLTFSIVWFNWFSNIYLLFCSSWILIFLLTFNLKKCFQRIFLLNPHSILILLIKCICMYIYAHTLSEACDFHFGLNSCTCKICIYVHVSSMTQCACKWRFPRCAFILSLGPLLYYFY